MRLTSPLVLTLLIMTSLPGLGASAGRRPQPVSPGGEHPGLVSEARCPTFSWAGAPEASGYELAVFRLSQGAVEQDPTLRVSLPPDSRSWTPSLGRCLERGGSYAWSIAATPRSDRPLEWAASRFFEIAEAPSIAELEDALRRLRNGENEGRGGRGSGAGARSAEESRPERGTPSRTRLERSRFRALLDPTAGIAESVRTPAAGGAPVEGSPSLRLDSSLSLAGASSVFKEGAPLLWDDYPLGNTAVGRNAMGSVSEGASGNTALGRKALQFATGGENFLTGSWNTAVGDFALVSNTTGAGNTAVGGFSLLLSQVTFGNTAVGFYALSGPNTPGESAYEPGGRNTAIGMSSLRQNEAGWRNVAVGTDALLENLDGSDNVAVGAEALGNNTTGSDNVAVGQDALQFSTGSRNVAIGQFSGSQLTAGDDNVFLQAFGSFGDEISNTLRIGLDTGTGPYELDRAFIQGIRGRTTAEGNAVQVLIDSEGQLGTASSARATKQDIRPVGELSERLLDLRPVAFRYRDQVAKNSDAPVHFGLIAEDVAQVFPELVVFDDEGRPETVKYRLLSSLLLAELQHQRELIERLLGLHADEDGRGTTTANRSYGVGDRAMMRELPDSSRSIARQ